MSLIYVQIAVPEIIIIDLLKIKGLNEASTSTVAIGETEQKCEREKDTFNLVINILKLINNTVFKNLMKVI